MCHHRWPASIRQRQSHGAAVSPGARNLHRSIKPGKFLGARVTTLFPCVQAFAETTFLCGSFYYAHGCKLWPLSQRVGFLMQVVVLTAKMHSYIAVNRQLAAETDAGGPGTGATLFVTPPPPVVSSSAQGIGHSVTPGGYEVVCSWTTSSLLVVFSHLRPRTHALFARPCSSPLSLRPSRRKLQSLRLRHPHLQNLCLRRLRQP